MMFVASVREKKDRIQCWSSSTNISACGTTLANEYKIPMPDAEKGTVSLDMIVASAG